MIGKKGYKHTKEAKRMISFIVKRRWQNPEYREKMCKIRKKLWQNSPNLNLLKSRLKEPILISNKFCPELAYILGVMIGDGFLQEYHKKNKHQYYCSLWVRDEEFALKFKKTLEKWSGLSTSIFVYHHKTFKQGFGYKVILHSKIIVKILQKNKKNLKNIILNSSIKNQIAFLEGFYDSEGSVGINPSCRVVRLSNTNRKLLKLSSIILNKLKIKTHNGSDKNCKYLLIYGKGNFYKFHKLIHFSIKKKQERLEQLANPETIRNYRI